MGEDRGGVEDREGGGQRLSIGVARPNQRQRRTREEVLGGREARELRESSEQSFQRLDNQASQRTAGRITAGAVAALAGGPASVAFAPVGIARLLGAQPQAGGLSNVTTPSEVRQRDLSAAGQVSRELRTSPATNVRTDTSGPDRVNAQAVATTINNARAGESAVAANRRLRLQNAKPRRSSVRIDFGARQAATRSGISVSN